LDEPFTGLDLQTQHGLLDLLERLSDRGVTCLVATHDLDLVLDVCERTIVLDRGKVAADGPTRLLLADDGLLGRCRLERPLSMRG